MYAPPPQSSDAVENLDYADGKWWGTELQVSKTVLSRHRITVGGEFRDNIRQSQSNYNLCPYELLLDDRRHSIVGAGFVQDEIRLTKALSLSAGFRYDYYSTIQGSGSPRAALIYKPRKTTTFKLLYARSFRVPNDNELYYSIPPNLPNPSLKPERIQTTEAVWEQGITSHAWFTVLAFYNSIHDLITADQTIDNSLIYRNLQNARSRGMEVEIKGEVAGLSAGASYTVQQTNDTTTTASLDNSPKTLVKLNLSQSLLRNRIFASLDAQYTSRMGTANGLSLPSYVVVNATVLGHNIGKHLDLSASVYNLFGKSYFDPPPNVTSLQELQRDGRSFRLKMTWHFGER